MINGQYQKIDAIISLVGHVATGTEEKGYTYKVGVTPPTKEAIETERLRLQAEYDALEYQRKRKAEYPPMADYLDAIVKGDDAQKQKYIDDCKAVKEKYPK